MELASPALAKLDATTRAILSGVALHLSVPVALLSRDGSGWRFEADAFPREESPAAGAGEQSPQEELLLSVKRGPQAWTGVPIGHAQRRDWLLIVPGSPDRWQEVSDLEDVIERIGRSLESDAGNNDAYLRHFGRRLFAFVRRLASHGGRPTHDFILRTLAALVKAQTASLAVYDDEEHALVIMATRGYPLAVVEHLRILPGQGVIGATFSSGRAHIGRCHPDLPRRLRYTTDSYLAVPIAAGGRMLAVVVLTDRADGQPFDARDLAAARMFAGPAALALVRERIAGDVDELTRAATVDPVTGLFNRRYFETRVLAEVQRARRQQQDLALLMVDIDDFKRINDTFGHLEGDRALREVADLLRGGVRIFDVCARYGGEEFAIVMPGAGRQMAIQVAERIRRGLHDRSRLDPLPITVSVGVGILGAGDSAEDLIGSADRALMLAKRGGKNTVRATGDER